VLLVAAVGQHLLAALAHDDGGAGVLAHGQHASRRDAGVEQQVTGHEPVIRARLGIVEDRPELAQVAGAEQVCDVPHGGLGQQAEHPGIDLEKGLPERLPRFDPVSRDLAVVGGVLAERQQVSIGKLGHLAAHPRAVVFGSASIVDR
jgi:hypothetical protein